MYLNVFKCNLKSRTEKTSVAKMCDNNIYIYISLSSMMTFSLLSSGISGKINCLLKKLKLNKGKEKKEEKEN